MKIVLYIGCKVGFKNVLKFLRDGFLISTDFTSGWDISENVTWLLPVVFPPNFKYPSVKIAVSNVVFNWSINKE